MGGSVCVNLSQKGARQRGQMMKTTESVCRVQIVGGIAFATTARADFGVGELRQSCDETIAQLAGYVPPVYVADFRPTAWRLKTLHLDALFDGVEPAIQRPAALVVPPEAEKLFRAHAWNVAQAGILRKVFTDYREAVAWAQRRAQLLSSVRTVR